MSDLRGKATLWLCVKFIALAPVCLVLWLLVLPHYTLALGHTTAAIIRVTMKVPIESVAITRDGEGILNTDVALSYRYGAHAPTMHDVGHLVTNVAPFVALVLATGGLGLWRRLRVLAIGILILFGFHVLTIVLRFSAGRTPLPTAVGFATITLPFLLWIVLAYWDKLSVYLGLDERDGQASSGTGGQTFQK
ncbi:MAG TPA: hypothetical protein PKO36_17085 [Candidatus Hydrogenedentes bacterium]|nr:hypothetical protein [Candidatus Hydrogenedentota bacterium]HOV75640.1 hypothetical protein [Candidatus Hydrogenedentota bacterium]HPC17495.1 hypothetical protein [Candidatus Hydrogenedentota bacterium]HRT21421.1 hypothetical protein [Candidatus Hydrogenedentota bacterium]HRT66309.1 hypothetical protein [Candidatus Hydrogenedentota bacterium]